MTDAIASLGASAKITPFNFNDNAVRVIDRDGSPWFVAADVCAALGYVNPRKAVADHLDDDERSTVTNSDCRPGHGAQQFTIINESGLYALVLRSRKPEARKFAKWVTAEVLPAIRKTGSYIAPEATATITPAQKQHLHELVDLIAASGKQSHAETWARLHRKFHVNKYELLRQDQFDAACAYLRTKMDGQDIRALVHKHFPDALRLEAPEPTIDPVQLLTTGQSEPLATLTSTQRTIIAQRAFELANEAYGLIHTHLERRVAFKIRPGEVTDHEVRAITLRTTLGNALAHHYLYQIDTLTSTVNWMQATVAKAANMLRDDMARFGQA